MTNEEMLILQFQNGDVKAFEKLIESIDHIIGTAVKKFAKTAFELGIDVNKYPKGKHNELEQECVIAIFNLCKTYRFDAKNPPVYFYVCCKNSIINYIWQVKNRTSHFYNNNFNAPEQISLDVFLPDEKSNLLDLISDESSQDDFIRVVDRIDNEILSKDIQFLLNKTFENNDKGKILSMLYGIGESRKTVKEICDLLNLNPVEVFEKENKALDIIRNSPDCSWFIKKYAPEYYTNSLARTEQIDNPEKYCFVKDVIQKKIYKLFNKGD